MASQTAQTTPAAKRRAYAFAGALAGLAVVILLFAVLFAANTSKPDQEPKAAAAPAAPTQPAEEPSPTAAEPTPTAPPAQSAEPTPAAQPVEIKTPRALRKPPVVKGGAGKVRKLTVTPLVKGNGPVVKSGQTVTANYLAVAYASGKQVDTSWGRGKPLQAPVGTGDILKALDRGLIGQRVGSRVQIDSPAAMAFGEQQGDIRFVVDILAAA